MRRQFKNPNRAAEKHIALCVDRRYARVRFVLGAIHLARFEAFLTAELLLNLHDRQHAAVLVREHNLGALSDRISIRG